MVKGDNSKHFSRKRKVGPKDIMSYLLNKKGMSQKMEMEFLNELGGYNISTPGMFKQREKFYPEAIVYLNDKLINSLYSKKIQILKLGKVLYFVQ